MLYIQLIGILAFLIFILSFYRKTPKMILIYQIVGNFAYAVHYFLLGALSGAFINFVGIFRNIAFLKYKNYRKLLAIIVIFIYSIITLIFYEGIYSIIPFIANSAYLLLMMKDTKYYLLIAGIESAVLWLIYAICVNSYAEIITESILIVSNIIQLIKLKSSRKTS